jgi:hypothetical protein
MGVGEGRISWDKEELADRNRTNKIVAKQPNPNINIEISNVFISNILL